MRATLLACAIASLWALLALPPIAFADEDAAGPSINYISADAVYVNVGSRAGLETGMRITVLRAGAEIAVLEVVHVSSHSASCRVVSQGEAPLVGDVIFFAALTRQPEAEAPASTTTEPAKAASAPRPGGNRVRGNVTLFNMWQRDLDGSELSSYQPGGAVRLSVSDPFGVPGQLRIRHRTRLYHRSQPRTTEPDTDEWTHRLSEFGWYVDGGGVRDAIGLGRVLNPFIRGLGYLDGGYASMRVGEHYRVGVAGGLDPRLEDSGLQPDQQKYGAFAAYERGSYGTRRLATTLALVGSYNGGAIDREFGYLQNTLSVARRLSLYHSMELDVNRGWRRDAEGSALSFSNTYATANATVTDYLGVDASYDARRNVRDYRAYDSPDSLFDDALSTGYSGGVSLSFPRHIRLRARAGVRFRDADDSRNQHASLSLSAAHFPVRSHSVSARLSISDTPFVTGYRPAMTYRFPATRRTYVTLGGGAYVYRQSVDTTTNGFGEIGLNHTFGRRYFATGHFRRTTGDGISSVMVLAEIGMSL